jgi:quercetin dioxygenase-like cupin family protein
MAVIRGEALVGLETPGGNLTTPLATASRGARHVRVIRQRQAPGGANPLHSHDRQEVLVMCAGTATLTLGDERVELKVGDTAIVPDGTLHRVENSGDVPAEWLLVLPANARFFAADGAEMHPAWAK